MSHGISKGREMMKSIHGTLWPRLAVAGVALIVWIVAGMPAALASNFHTSAWYSAQSSNGLACKWQGHHEWDYDGTWGAFYGWTQRSGDCAEVSVKLRVSGSDLWDWDENFASVITSGWNLVLNYSDHNADPVGPPVYVGFRLT